MKTYTCEVEADVRVGEDVLSIRRKGSSEVVQAKILARELEDGGRKERIWLDRLVHAGYEEVIGGNPVTGSYVTEILVSKTNQ